MDLTSFLFKSARTAATVKAVSKGPKATAKRAKNIAIGRMIGRTGIWR